MVVALQDLGIKQIVHQMRLSDLAVHIADSLHEMTTRNQKASPGKLTLVDDGRNSY